MRRSIRYLLVGMVVASFSTAGTFVAYASWSINGDAAIKASAETMPKGATPSVAAQAKTAVVSWNAQELTTGVKMDRYVVTAHSVDEPPLADVVHAVAASGGSTESLTFTAADVAGGKWYWTIVPKFRLWAGAQSGESQKLDFPDTPTTGPASPTAPAPVAASPPATPTVVAPTTSPAAPPTKGVTASATVEATPTPPATEAEPVEAATPPPAAAPTSSGTDDSIVPPAPPAPAQSPE